MKAEPIRSCVVCRGRAEQSILLRFVGGESAGAPQVDCGPGVKAGRGAYCHVSAGCLLHPSLAELLRFASLHPAERGSVPKGLRRGKGDRGDGVRALTSALREQLLKEIEARLAAIPASRTSGPEKKRIEKLAAALELLRGTSQPKGTSGTSGKSPDEKKGRSIIRGGRVRL